MTEKLSEIAAVMLKPKLVSDGTLVTVISKQNVEGATVILDTYSKMQNVKEGEREFRGNTVK